MATVKAVLNKDRIKKQGDYSLVVQIIHKRVKRVIYTPYKLQESEFDAMAQKAIYTNGVRYTHNQIREINRFVGIRKGEIGEIINHIIAHNRNFTAEDIVSKYRLDQSDKYLVTFMERHIAKKRSLGKNGTARAFHSTLLSLKKYIGSREVKFIDVDSLFMKGYEEFLANRNVKQNTAGFYLRNFRTIYNLAEDSGIEIGDGNAFRRVKIRTVKTVKRAIKQAVVEKIALMDLTDDSELDKARDLFMFSFYTRGMSFVDIIHLRHKDITDGVICYCRRKTGLYMEIAVTVPLQKLLDKYATDPIYVLPFINQTARPTLYQQYITAYGILYRNLNRLKKQLELSTPLTTYVARHSWATIAKEHGTSTTVISEGLGHTSEKTTRIYLKNFDRSVIDRVNEKIASFSAIQFTV